MQAYDARIEKGELQDDASQRGILRRFELLNEQLVSPKARKFSLLSWLNNDQPDTEIKGIYLWGEVGRGKSMLMDLFFDHLPDFIPARRIHFHAFMTEIHEALYNLRDEEPDNSDPLPIIAKQFAKDCRILCLDEFQVHDIADAMILSRLFESLLQEKVVTVTTSNRPPDGLYANGLQRDSFLPFIALVKEHFTVKCLDHPTDYRLEKIKGSETFHIPGDDIAPLEQLFNRLRQHPPQPHSLNIKGRQLTLAKTADGMAWASFDELCANALGAEDYNCLAQEFHTLFLTHIPILTPDHRNEARRFVHLVDALYEHRTRLICSADASPQEIYQSGDGSFEFQRTISRLIEMQSTAYLGATHKL